jgi:hypothetical protein
MALAAPAPKVKLICGMISSREALLAQAREVLNGKFGPCDIVSEIMPFDFTHYYDQEMGSPLYRQFVAFEGLCDADVLVEAKVASNEIEQECACCGAPLDMPARIPNSGIRGGMAPAQTHMGGTPMPRPINLDPGYIESGKLVLASMKNFSHRIYMGRGVFGEVTMQYRHGTWAPLPWTFPDYASGRYFGFLDQARERLMSGRGGTGLGSTAFPGCGMGDAQAGKPVPPCATEGCQ